MNSLDYQWIHWIINEFIGLSVNLLNYQWIHWIINGFIELPMDSLNYQWIHWIINEFNKLHSGISCILGSVWCCSFVGPFHKATKLQRQTAKSEATAPNGQYKATTPNGQSTKSQHPMGILLLYHTWPPLPDKATMPNGQHKATAPNEQPQSYKATKLQS